MELFFAGLWAGFLATFPMSLFMGAAKILVPQEKEDPLPPRKITMNLAQKVHVKERLSEPWRTVLTVVFHFGYGAVMGGVFIFIAQGVPVSKVMSGIVFGLFLWAGSYLGWLPAMKLIAPATRIPLSRNILMVTAHIIWGGTTGLILQKWF